MQGDKLKQNYIQGRLNNVDMVTTHGAKEVVVGFITVNSAPAMVLFDPSASHSFISRECVEDHKITMLPMRKPMIVNSPGGEMEAGHICPKVSLNIKGKFIQDHQDIDSITGEGLSSEQETSVKCLKE